MDEKRRERILAVAAEKFEQYGLRRVTMDDIAHELGMSKKTLYKVFQGKEALVDEYVRRSMEQRLGEVFTAMESADKVTDCFGAVYRRIFAFSSKISQPFMRDLKREYPQIWERVQLRRARGLQRYTALIRKGVEQGEIRPSIDPEIATGIISAVINNYMVPETFDEGKEPNEVARTWFTMLTSGLFITPPSLEVTDDEAAGDKSADETPAGQ
ncbi:TetR/AcrR family transcriptional regulator [Desulfobaculum sp. SPO524]|uniref:TetR/AcrR family transcriptional regulator n=1 Tax=Desulfobaculum sp. SPO524 TaxID=3378071 RepID=UPI00385262C3